jgi:hypothetical protein
MTFLDVLRRVAGRPPLAIKVILALGVTAAIGVALFEPPFQVVFVMAVGIPLTAWLIRRAR